jgi:ParB-like chromosome segregation protein Spo0J
MRTRATEKRQRQQKQYERDRADLRILELLDEGGLSHRAIADIVGCSPQHVSDLRREAME